MGGKRKHRRRHNSQSQSGSDSSALKISTDSEVTCSSKKQKFLTSTPAVQETLSKFAFEPRGEEDNMADIGERIGPDNAKGAVSPLSCVSQDRVVSNVDLMDKLCENGKEISRLARTVEELKAALLTVQIENDKMKKEMSEARKREQLLQDQLTEIKHLAELADNKTEDLSAYIRRNNIRVYGVEEGEAAETAQQCEDKIIALFNNKLKVQVRREDIEAVHRVGARPSQATGQRQGTSPSGQVRNNPRGTIVRFVSRRVRDSVLYARKCLKGSRVVIVEDLTPRTYQLLCTVKADKTVCQQAWTKNGSVVMKALNGQIVTVKSLADFRQTDQRARWAQLKR